MVMAALPDEVNSMFSARSLVTVVGAAMKS
jgi:hypothetical protein